MLPVAAKYGCSGDEKEIIIEIQPEPILVTGLDEEVCSNVASGIILDYNTSAIAADSYTIVNISIPGGLIADASNATTGTNNDANAIVNDKYINNTNAPLDVTYEINPVSIDGCNGDVEQIVLTVNAVPVLTSGLDNTVCDGIETGILFSTVAGSASATGYNITGFNVLAGLTPDGGNTITGTINNVDAGAIQNDKFTNTTYGELEVVYTVVPVTANCEGQPVDITLTVNPTPIVNVTENVVVVCDGDEINIVLNTPNSPSNLITFDYSIVDPSGDISGYASQTGVFNGHIISDALYTSSTSPMDITYTITPEYNGVCIGESVVVTVTVNPIPIADISGTDALCLGNTSDMNVSFSEGTSPFTVKYSNSSSGSITEISGLNETDVIPVTPSEVGSTTYRLTYIEDANGCNVSANPIVDAGDYVVTVNENLTFFLSATKNDICSGEEIELTFNTSGGIGPFDVDYTVNGEAALGDDVVNGNTVTYTLTETTTFITTAVVDTGFPGCEPTSFGAPVTVTVHDYPIATISGDNEICEDDTTTISIELTGTGPWDVRYSTDAGVTNTLIPSIANNGSPTIYSFDVTPDVGQTIYQLVDVRDFSSPLLCIGNVDNGSVSGSAIIDVNSLPTASVSGTINICNGDETDITFNLSGEGPYDLTYSDGSTNSLLQGVTDGETISVSPDTTTAYSIILVEDSNTPKCSPDDYGENVIITVNDLPTATFVSETTTVCDGDEIVLELKLTGNGPFTVMYQDDLNIYTENVSGSSGQFTHTASIGETRFSLISVEDSNNPMCSGIVSGEKLAIVNERPTAFVSVGGSSDNESTVEICEGDNTEVTFTFTGKAPFKLVYEVNMFAVYTIENIETSTYTINVEPEDDETYEIISISDDNNPVCEGSASGRANVVVYDTPVADFNVDILKGCAPLDVNFDNFSTGNLQGENSGYYYRESGVTEYTLMTHDRFATFIFENTTNQSKDFDVMFIAESVLGCADSTIKVITVDPSLQLDVSFDDDGEGCTPYTVTFNNHQVLNNILYIWDWGDGTQLDTTTSESSITHEFINNSTISAKSFGIKVTAINPDTECNDETQLSIRVYPEIFVEISSDINRGCAPFNVLFNNRSEGVSTHEWYYQVKGTTDVTDLRTTQMVDYQFRNETQDSVTYEVIYTGTNRFDCELSDTLEVVVGPEFDAAFTALPERQVLPNSTIDINDLTNEGPWNYEWDFGDGKMSTDSELTEYTYDTYGTYQIVLDVSYGKCSDQATQFVVIEAITPVIDFTANVLEGCRPLTVSFTNLSQFVDEDTYYWEFGDGQGQSFAMNPTYTFYEPGQYTIVLEGTNGLGISVQEKKEAYITVYDVPTANFNIRPSIVYIPGQSVFSSNGSFGDGVLEYQWDWGDGDMMDTDFEPTHEYEEPGVYDVGLYVTNEFGCTDSLIREKAVIAEPGGDIQTPNVFTPDPSGPGGGIGGGPGNPAFNNTFIPYMEGTVEFHMQIFNRWGEMLFESYDKNVGWDGWYKNKLAPADVYVYKLNVRLADGSRVTKVGDVLLLR